MQPKRENQPPFFDLAGQQRGSANRVLETIGREVNFTSAEERVAATTLFQKQPLLQKSP
jgi:hypothetical protein